MDIAAPDILNQPINVPNKTLLGPGPASAHPRVLAAGALPLLGHLHPEFCKIMDECKAGIKYVFQTANRLTLAVSGTGHAAMEMTVSNLVERGDKVLVFTNGIWGDRYSDMVRRVGGVALQVKKVTEKFTLDEINKAVEEHTPKIIFITQGESSVSLHQPLDGIGDIAHKHGALLVVDSVASAGGVPLFMDRWGIDVLYTGPQKVLGAPPGASPISFSELAWNKFKNRSEPASSFYMDLAHLANYWGCDDEPARRYHHTGMITSVYQLREALAMVAEEGLENIWNRHKEASNLLRNGLTDMGLSLYITDPEAVLPTVTGVFVPDGVDWKEAAKYLMTKYRIEISGGLGPSAGKIWRIGLMGMNARPDVVQRLLKCFKEALECKAAHL